MPTFMAMVMVLWMASGMVILREIENYTKTELSIIIFSFGICLLGVYVIMQKIKM